MSCAVLAAVWMVSYIGCAIWFGRLKRIAVIEGNNDNHLYVQYGDLFSKDVIVNRDEKRSIVIPVNRCFDTLVDNDLVSERTLHGIAVQRLMNSGYTEDTLNETIQEDLRSRQGLKPELMNRENKQKEIWKDIQSELLQR